MRVIRLSKEVFASAYCQTLRAQNQYQEQINNLSFGGLCRQLSMGDSGITIVLDHTKSRGEGIRLNVSDSLFDDWIQRSIQAEASTKRAMEKENFKALVRAAKRNDKLISEFTSWVPEEFIPPTNEGNKP